MYLSENIQEKWAPVMEHADLPEIKDTYRRDVTLRLLENQEKFLNEAAPTNSTGANIDNWDPILISLVRRSMPQMIAYDVAGVQPMTGPTGLIFAMKSHYDNQTGTEALGGSAGTSADETLSKNDEADTSHSGTGTHAAQTNAVNPFTDPQNTFGTGVGTAAMEAFGSSGGGTYKEMAFSIDKTSVTAKSRALKAEYSTELAQDLKAVHGLDAETELANILSTEILQEINREVIRTILTVARLGAQHNTTTAGKFDLDTDSNGRWSVEKFKGLMFQIERDRNEVGHQTRRGKANFMICSADVASALSMAGMLESGHALATDDTMSTYAGTMNGMKIYVDPYFVSYPAGSAAKQFYCLGYKGSSPYDAGLFYCPYVPLQMVRAMGENTFQPKIGFKTRYGMVKNPFVGSGGETMTANENQYYRKVEIANLM